MKTMTIIILFLIFTNLLFAQFPDKNFEIVESIPEETMLDNPEIRNTLEVWLEMIYNAKTSIDIEQFYICNDKNQPLETVIQAIEKKASEGIKIRIIAEKKMAKTYPKTIARLAKSSNIETRILSAFSKIHGINHSKYFIIDKERIFLGSQNFDWKAISQIHEIGINIKHKELVQTFSEIFELNWRQAKTGILEKTAKHGKQTIYSMDINDEIITIFPTASPYYNMPEKFYSDELAIIESINKAKTSIKIQLLSYSPSAYNEYYENLDNAIRSAALRGVKVQLLFSDWCSKSYEIPYLKSLQILPNIDIKLSTIPENSSGYITFARVEHCKFMLVDNNVTWIGTSNWKKNYFYASRNLGLIINSKTINNKLDYIFDKSWNSEYANIIDINKNYIPKKYGEK